MTTTYTITDETGKTMVEADSLNAACVEYAHRESIPGVACADDLADASDWLYVHDPAGVLVYSRRAA